MDLKEATEYLEKAFDYQTEIRSYMQDMTDNGVFTREDMGLFDTETMIAVAEDVQAEVRREISYLFD